MGKVVWSLLISVAVLFIAKQIGWIGFTEQLPVLTANIMWNQLIWLAIIAVILTAVGTICAELYFYLSLLTCGLGCFLFPVYVIAMGYLKLMAVAYLLPGFTHTDIWWQVLLLSMFVGVSIPSSGTSSTTRISSSSSSD